MIDLAIVGAGNLGSHHIAGLLLSTKIFHIHIVDSNKNAIVQLNKRFNYFLEFKNKHSFTTYDNINELPSKISFAIIATTADSRKAVVELLSKKCELKYLLLEKVVFQSSSDFKPVLSILKRHSIKTWINFPRRTFDIYKKIKSQIFGEIISIKVVGNDWGLASNSIHMIDLFSYMTGQGDLIFNTDQLKKAIFNSKRKNYKELKGVLKVETKRGDKLIIKDEKKYNNRFEISIFTPSVSFKIFEHNRLVKKYVSNQFHSQTEINLPYQSELTGRVIDQIINTNDSDLTPYEECIPYHMNMLDYFQLHFSKFYDKKISKCPIT